MLLGAVLASCAADTTTPGTAAAGGADGSGGGAAGAGGDVGLAGAGGAELGACTVAEAQEPDSICFCCRPLAVIEQTCLECVVDRDTVGAWCAQYGEVPRMCPDGNGVQPPACHPSPYVCGQLAACPSLDNCGSTRIHCCEP